MNIALPFVSGLFPKYSRTVEVLQFSHILLPSIPHLSISGTTPPPTASPSNLKVKSEPMSPRQPGGHGGGGGGGHNDDPRHNHLLSPGGLPPSDYHASPGHSVSPGPPQIHIHQVHQMEGGYEGMPVSKRIRIAENWNS